MRRWKGQLGSRSNRCAAVWLGMDVKSSISLQPPGNSSSSYPRLSAFIGGSRQRGVENFLNQRIICHAVGVRRLREVVLGGKRRVGVGFDDEHFILRRKPDIDAAKTADSQPLAKVAGDLAQVLLHGFGKLGGG